MTKKKKININKKAKREIDKHPFVVCKWIDIVSDSSWVDTETALKLNCAVCITKGHLLSRKNGIVRIFGDYNLVDEESGEIDSIGNLTLIPEKVVVSLEKK